MYPEYCDGGLADKYQGTWYKLRLVFWYETADSGSAVIHADPVSITYSTDPYPDELRFLYLLYAKSTYIYAAHH